MGEAGVLLRDAREEDISFILRVNEENVAVLSPMDKGPVQDARRGRYACDRR